MRIFLMMLIAIFGLLFLSMCCKDEPTKPPDEIIKNPREYVWTVDTLAYPGSMQVYMKSIWASSPTDVYVVGHNERGFGKMYHFNGISWTDVKLSTAQGGQIDGAIDLVDIIGFGSNDIYAVGEKIYTNPAPPPNFLDSSLIIHFDGTQWREIQIPRMRGLASVWGANSQDVWADGYYGSLYHFDGLLWNRILIDTTLSFGNIFGLSPKDVYTTCARILDKDNQRDSTQYLMYHFNSSSWSAIDSSYEFLGYYQERFGFNLWGTTTSIYSANQAVYKKTGSSWIPILNTGLPFYSIFGTDDNNFFVGGYGNQIYHFNGTDWFQFKQLSDATKFCTSIWCNDKEAFIVSGDGSKTWIFHGK